MEPDPKYDVLIADLRSLGRSVPMIENDSSATDLTASVMNRLADVPHIPTVSRWQRLRHWAGEALARRRRRILVVATVVLLGCLGVPGVRAAVVDWFTFNGVSVHIQPIPRPSVTEAPPPPTAHGTSLDRVYTLVDFQPIILASLGTPEGVEVSADRRLLSLTWNGPEGATTRLDQFDGTLDGLFAKTTPGSTWTTVAERMALWFEDPHEVVILADDGKRRTETARLAGHTLIWEHDGTVLRLEGSFTHERAVEIAESAKALP